MDERDRSSHRSSLTRAFITKRIAPPTLASRRALLSVDAAVSVSGAARISLVPVLVLLPPSQGKASPDRGRRVGLSTLVHSRLRKPREQLIDAVDPGLRTAPAIGSPPTDSR